MKRPDPVVGQRSQGSTSSASHLLIGTFALLATPRLQPGCRIVRHLLAALALGTTLAGTGFADDIPDPTKTPGAIRPGLTRAKICSIRWGRDERHVSDAMKQQVFEAYGLSGNDDARCVPDARGRRCEIDHLISRELGGADEVKNLWPQTYGTSPWNAALKDKLENRLHVELCAGRISLDAARAMLVNDWRKAYEKYYGKP